MYHVNWLGLVRVCVCECRLEIKDLYFIVFYVWVVNRAFVNVCECLQFLSSLWNQFERHSFFVHSIMFMAPSFQLPYHPSSPSAPPNEMPTSSCDVILLIVTYCLPCSLISFISIFACAKAASHYIVRAQHFNALTAYFRTKIQFYRTRVRQQHCLHWIIDVVAETVVHSKW